MIADLLSPLPPGGEGDVARPDKEPAPQGVRSQGHLFPNLRAEDYKPLGRGLQTSGHRFQNLWAEVFDLLGRDL
jgi:hypothetical protein